MKEGVFVVVGDAYQTAGWIEQIKEDQLLIRELGTNNLEWRNISEVNMVDMPVEHLKRQA